MTDIQDILKEMRSVQLPGLDVTMNAWADAIEAAMREPVAELVRTSTGSEWAFSLMDPPIGTRLFQLPPNPTYEVKRLYALVDTQRQKIDEAGREILRLKADYPDKDKLEACRESLRDHMAMVRERDERVERMRELLKQARDLAEYWINRECTVNYSQQEYNSWLALGHQSNAMEAIRTALAKKMREES